LKKKKKKGGSGGKRVLYKKQHHPLLRWENERKGGEMGLTEDNRWGTKKGGIKEKSRGPGEEKKKIDSQSGT